jgi:hypothetical protein
MSCGRTIDVVENSLVMKRKNGFDSQKWIFNDESRTIQSVGFPGKSMGINSDASKRVVELYQTSSKWF